MTAQCFLFFVAGFDTSSTVLSCALHEVAANPEVLKKLQKEIEVHLKKYNGQVTYEMMKSMPYLHQVVSGKRIGIKDAILAMKSLRVISLLSELGYRR